MVVSPPQSPKGATYRGMKSPTTPEDARSPTFPDPAIEAATEDGEEDEFAADDYDARTFATTSATSSVYAHTYEHGRRYQLFKNSRYPIPNDDLEQDREDMKHAMLLELLDGKLFVAPIREHPQLIVDVGTGTGIWAIEAGDTYPSARVRGVDVSPIQPSWIPPNVDFIVDDCEHSDGLGLKDADFIHFRFMAMVLRKMPVALSNAYESLKPGGWIELQELLGVPLCDDGTMPDDDPVKRVYDLAGQAFGKFGMDVQLASTLGTALEEAGFTEVQCVKKKVPIGHWPRDKTLRVIGYYQQLAVETLLPSLGGRPFTALGLNPVEIELLLTAARKGLRDNSVHRYFEYYFWYAQKPQEEGI